MLQAGLCLRKDIYDIPRVAPYCRQSCTTFGSCWPKQRESIILRCLCLQHWHSASILQSKWCRSINWFVSCMLTIDEQMIRLRKKHFHAFLSFSSCWLWVNISFYHKEFHSNTDALSQLPLQTTGEVVPEVQETVLLLEQLDDGPLQHNR